MALPTPTPASADIGVTGMGVMGSNLARNLARNGYKVAIHNRSTGPTEAVFEKHGGGDEGEFIPAVEMDDFVASLQKPRVAIIMVKAGAATDAVIEQLAERMDEGDIIVDCGNTLFHDTRRREAALKERGLHFVGVGVSGGEEGALWGPSIMPGGSRESYDRLGPMFEKISAHVDGEPCCTYIGADGAGHFVKMVHNGIEYADMQVIGEAYDLL
ncbi:MAG: NAD(P)-binding domain-containing protein, partial [Propionibacterium sp.]|nr:NAD(P)-binding domain-containing protein [Propionibacterium sp.]